ncbi:MAG: O-antigen ligase family protein [Parvularculaceae bacterium]|nr:O-antigen ligase family protein [Parvularculaceae bacterium]
MIAASANTFLAALASLVFVLFLRAPRALAVRIAALWACSAAVAFAVANTAIVFVVFAVLLLTLAPSNAGDRTRFFLATFFAIPDLYTVRIPFPGLNYLVDLDFVSICALIVLAPAAIKSIGKPKPKGLALLDTLVAVYIVVNAALALRDIAFTSAIRTGVTDALAIWLPYFCLTRTIRSPDDLRATLLALLQGLAALAVIGLISAAEKWNYYAHLMPGSLNYKFFSDFRFGILRIAATMNGPPLGVLMGVGAALTLQQFARKRAPVLVLAGMFAVFSFVCFATGSRGGWAGAAAALVVFAGATLASPGLRKFSLVSGGLASFAVAIALTTGQASVDDQFGTFSYRQKLMQVGMEQVGKAPLFGVPNVTELPEFQPLRQGEGIVDLVNMYLQISLYKGLIGLAVFLLPIVVAAGLGLRALARTDAERRDPAIRQFRSDAAVSLALTLGMLVMAFTTSHTKLMFVIFFLAAALSAAAYTASRNVEAPPPAPPPADEDATTSKTPPPSPRPYGARFFRNV